MLELDFSRIQFCGRQEELSKLQLAFDEACNQESPPKRRRRRQKSHPRQHSQDEELKQPEQQDGTDQEETQLHAKKTSIGPIAESSD